MAVHLVNPSHLSFGVGVITPRWLFVLAGATPNSYGIPVITDETLEPLELERIGAGDIVGIGIHTGNALRGYELGNLIRARGLLRLNTSSAVAFRSSADTEPTNALKLSRLINISVAASGGTNLSRHGREGL